MNTTALSTAPLAGRAREVELAAGVLDRLRGGAAPLLVVTGEPGIGKTRVLAEIAELARERRSVALRGAATEMERPYPYGVVVDALDGHLSELGLAQLGRLTAEQRGLLAEIFPALSGFRAVQAADPPIR